MTERLDNLEEQVKYLIQAVDRIGGMVQLTLANMVEENNGKLEGTIEETRGLEP